MAIEVATAADLNNVRNNLSGDYIQTADIDMSGYAWNEPIGYWDWFSGTYNGNNKKIINHSSRHSLFGYNNGLITGVNMVDINMVTTSGTPSGNHVFATLNEGEIKNCSFRGQVETLSNGASPIAENSGLIEECWSNIDITVHAGGIWAEQCSGLVGYDNGGTIRNCFSRGNLVVLGSPYIELCGGLLGYGKGTTITNCYTTFSIPDLTGDSHGGLCGMWFANPAIATNSYYDEELTFPGADNGIGEPRATVEMTYPENFTTTFIDWDFTNIWRHDPTYTINDGYPHFGVGFNIWVKKSGAWQPVTDIWARKGGVWQPVSSVDVNKDGWKPI